MFARPRSFLYLPATSTRLLARAGQRGADTIVLDLEDAIAPTEKHAARKALATAIASLRGSVAAWVRINAQDDLVIADIDAAMAAGCDGIVIPKVESADDVLCVTQRLAERFSGAAGIGLQAIIETPKGLLRLAEIASASAALTSLAFGSEDFATALGISPTPEAMRLPAQMVAIAAASAGLHPIGLAGSIAGYTDLVAFERIVRLSRKLGMHGAACIHPAQLAVLNDVFGPSVAEQDRARELIAVYDQAVTKGLGAVALDGSMVDAPVVERARALLARAGKIA